MDLRLSCKYSVFFYINSEFSFKRCLLSNCSGYLVRYVAVLSYIISDASNNFDIYFTRRSDAVRSSQPFRLTKGSLTLMLWVAPFEDTPDAPVQLRLRSAHVAMCSWSWPIWSQSWYCFQDILIDGQWVFFWSWLYPSISYYFKLVSDLHIHVCTNSVKQQGKRNDGPLQTHDIQQSFVHSWVIQCHDLWQKVSSFIKREAQ